MLNEVNSPPCQNKDRTMYNRGCLPRAVLEEHRHPAAAASLSLHLVLMALPLLCAPAPNIGTAIVSVLPVCPWIFIVYWVFFHPFEVCWMFIICPNLLYALCRALVEFLPWVAHRKLRDQGHVWIILGSCDECHCGGLHCFQ